MRKLLSIMLLLVAAVVLVACGPSDNDTTNTTAPSTSGTTGGGGSTTETTDGGDETTFDLGGIDFIIMCDRAQRCDPRNPDFRRPFKNEKIDLINKVESKYNVKVVFESYPTEASWGGARERWIIEQTSLGNSPAHVYELTSYQIGTLATQNAILPLDDLIERYGSDLLWPEVKLFGEFRGKNYTYHDQYPISDEGIYYNADLLANYLGEERRNEPSELWLAGEWDWDAFTRITDELVGALDHERTPEEGGPQYVLGGRTYNWAYQFIGANGGNIVTPDFEVKLSEDAAVDALNYLHDLYSTPGMWIANAPLNNASQPEFRDGNVAFHNGQSYWIFQDNKWQDREFEIGFVPYPVGPNVKEDMSNYYINDVYGKAAFVISAAYSKDLIPPGYEDLMMHDEIIFQIWADLQYFPERDPETGHASVDVFVDEFYFTRLLPYYDDEASREAHISIVDVSYPDYFYSMNEANNHTEEAYMLKIQNAIINGEIRQKMISLTSEVQATLIDKYDLGEDFYN